jgi:raffinose synthase
VRKHFDGRLINCMSNAQETFYGSSDSTLLRTSMDFLPTRPESHGVHLYDNAQVGVWFGEFMQPDWDMFQSGHAWGAYHAAARAVSGGPVYVSDKPGEHDAEVIARLVCSDGSVLRCDAPGRPTLDVLFRDPTKEDVLLKIWNRSGRAGVVGVFNARVGKDGEKGPVLSGTVSPLDVLGLEGERFAAFRHTAQTLETLGRNEATSVALAERGYEIFSFVPIERDFAAVGLANLANSHGAVRALTWDDERTVTVTLADGGLFVAYSPRRPTAVESSGTPLTFEHDATSGALRVPLPLHGPLTLRLHL